jgi:hypothetical protein
MYCGHSRLSNLASVPVLPCQASLADAPMKEPPQATNPNHNGAGQDSRRLPGDSGGCGWAYTASLRAGQILTVLFRLVGCIFQLHPTFSMQRERDQACFFRTG